MILVTSQSPIALLVAGGLCLSNGFATVHAYFDNFTVTKL
jgi:hypothetical protein